MPEWLKRNEVAKAGTGYQSGMAQFASGQLSVHSFRHRMNRTAHRWIVCMRTWLNLPATDILPTYNSINIRGDSMSNKVLHLIRIENTGEKIETGLACTPDWFGKRITNDPASVTCQNCMGTDFFKKKAARNG